MLVSICPVLFGHHVFVNADNSSKFDYLSRRISRTATLDGSCFILDNGYSASDGNITIIIKAVKNKPELQTKLMNLIKQFGEYTLSSQHGLFIVAFDSMDDDKGDLKLNFLIKDKVI